MTKKVLKIKRYPKEYKFDIEKLKEKLGEVAYLYKVISISEDFEYFNDVKHLLIIPEESKSIEEIQQEFHDKIDELIEQTKKNFYASNLTAERTYHDFCNRQNSAFDYMQKNGRAPTLYGIDYSKVYLNSSSSNEIITTLNPGNVVGYYEITPGFLLVVKQKPSKLVRFFMKTLLNWRYKDA